MLTKSGSQAIKAVVALAELPEGSFAGTGTIAQKIGSPQNYLGKLMQRLSRHGLLVSQKGLGGGFQLSKKPQDISLYEVVEPIDHVSKWKGCILGQSKCLDKKPCLMHKKWKTIRNGYLNFLEETTIADLMEDK